MNQIFQKVVFPLTSQGRSSDVKLRRECQGSGDKAIPKLGTPEGQSSRGKESRRCKPWVVVEYKDGGKVKLCELNFVGSLHPLGKPWGLPNSMESGLGGV